MAMAKPQRSTSSRFGLWLLLIFGIAIAGALYAWREPIHGYASVGTSYAARVACSCRFVAGRAMEDCEKDKLAGMELVTLVDDPEAKSVTARFPLVTSSTATYREGYGCVLEP
ncbi:hypothetical protein [Erythrobacter sp. JK5]|uniref:hypothetical protein n=1 Tax=Erythrobacter sp. JK5 TaxID=2829500 RepID=UPI001BA7C878|nr:hypothetical protein [Erythrobacter sp. JK5]QUL37361.1 hypothetical protein KDC96_13475 [Erythrobacter sp. JK5]